MAKNKEILRCVPFKMMFSVIEHLLEKNLRSDLYGYIKIDSVKLLCQSFKGSIQSEQSPVCIKADRLDLSF